MHIYVFLNNVYFCPLLNFVFRKVHCIHSCSFFFFGSDTFIKHMMLGLVVPKPSPSPCKAEQENGSKLKATWATN